MVDDGYYSNNDITIFVEPLSMTEKEVLEFVLLPSQLIVQIKV